MNLSRSRIRQPTSPNTRESVSFMLSFEKCRSDKSRSATSPSLVTEQVLCSYHHPLAQSIHIRNHTKTSPSLKLKPKCIRLCSLSTHNWSRLFPSRTLNCRFTYSCLSHPVPRGHAKARNRVVITVLNRGSAHTSNM